MNVVIHGHFYQPPRMNPWTGQVPHQESARPAHDWNQRITDECYRPNGASRVMGSGNLITEIVNNYALMSFDFGPTLLAWLETQAPQTYQRILSGDRLSQERQSGHGNAIAHAYNHMILPLANRRDKQTQVVWGLRDFARRFGRPSESLWLPETAVDRETIDVLIEQGVRFIVLAPTQAGRVRTAGQRGWSDVQGGRIDARRSYRYLLRDERGRTRKERSLAVFFYDGPIANDISFGHLLRSAPVLGERLRQAAQGMDPAQGFVSVATDGEVYGHHEPFADMCFAYLARREAPGRGMQLTNYGRLLAESPPTDEVDLDFGDDGRGTSWSCAHGVGRWERDCGCSTGGQRGWNQAWREPLRKGLDAVRDRLAAAFAQQTTSLLADPWAARDDYIEILLDPAPQCREAFLERHAARRLTSAERQLVWRLLAAQRYAMYMYTSCGWFFADVSGVEPVQNMAYAARAIELAQPGIADDLQELLLDHLARARSNLREMGSGADIFRRFVRPQHVRPQIVVGEAALTAAVRRTSPPSDLLGRELEAQGFVAGGGGDGVIRSRLTLRDPASGETSGWSVHVFGVGTPDVRAYVGAEMLTSGQPAADKGTAPAGGALSPAREAPPPADETAQPSEEAALPSEETLRAAAGVTRLTLGDLVSEEREAVIRDAFRKELEAEARALERIFDGSRALMDTLRAGGLPVPGSLSAIAREVLARRLATLSAELAAAAAAALDLPEAPVTGEGPAAEQVPGVPEAPAAEQVPGVPGIPATLEVPVAPELPIAAERILDRIAAILDFARAHALELPTDPLARSYGRILEGLLERLGQQFSPLSARQCVEFMRTSYPLQFPLDRRPLEDLAFCAFRSHRAEIRRCLERGAADETGAVLIELADSLGMDLPRIIEVPEDTLTGSGMESKAPSSAHKEVRT